MGQNREKLKNSGEQQKLSSNSEKETADARERMRENDKRGRILQCLGNLNALHKVQGALLGQMEREIG